MRKLNVGIVGFGGSALAQYRIFQRRNDTRVTTVFDPKEAGRERARRQAADISIVGTLDAFWAAQPEVISVCSPDRSHATYVVEAIKRGLPVLCEKPLTDSLEGVASIQKAARAYPGVVVAVQHQMRFLPLSEKIKSLMKEKALGAVSYLEGYYVHDLRRRAWSNDTWRADDNATPLVYCGCHFVDLLRWWLGEEVVEVFAMGNHLAFPKYPESDLNVLLLRFESGVIGKVVVSFGTTRPQDHTVRIFGNQKSIDDSILFSGGRGFEVLSRPLIMPALAVPSRGLAGFGNLRAWIVDRMVEMIVRCARLPSEYSFNHPPIRLYEHSLAVEKSVNDFVESVVCRRKPLCTIDEATRTVEICLAGIESMRTGSPVKMSEFLKRGKETVA